MKKLIYLLILVMIMSGCGYNMRETYIRSKRPDYLKSYKNGPISPLSKEVIQEAIEFGKTNKHKQEIINYAFTFKKDITHFLGDTRSLYILICTNYYMVADYAAEQTRNYETIDMDYVNFLANLPTFRIEVVDVLTPDPLLYSFQTQGKFVLLKNGVKVEESNTNPLYNKKSPYYASHLWSTQSNWQEAANEAIKKGMEMANEITRAYQKDAKIDINSVPGLPISKPSYLYNYKDIDLSSKYEIVVIYQDGEYRISIDFLGIK